jgi:hypothetical protein
VLAKVTIEPKEALRAGIEFQFSGQQEDENGDPISEFVNIDLIVPPLNLDSLQAMESRLKALKTDPDIVSMKTMVDALEHALKRNYRGVPRWLISQTLDVGNMSDLTLAFMDLGGMKRKEIEAGKALAAADKPVADKPTGTPSTAA